MKIKHICHYFIFVIKNHLSQFGTAERESFESVRDAERESFESVRSANHLSQCGARII